MTTAIVPYNQDANLAQYMRQLGNYAVLDREEEERLAELYQKSGDVEAARMLVLGNLRFVVKIAFTYRKYSVPIMELIQEGNLGLMEAVSKYKSEKGYRLITYAVWWIRAYIQKYILDTWSIVRRGTTRAQRKLFYGMNKKTNELEQAKGGAVSIDELADAMDVSPKEIEAMQALMKGGDVSLDAPLGEENDSYVDFLRDAGPDQEQTYIENEQSKLLNGAVDTVRSVLSERDLAILERRVLSEEPATLEELSRDYSVSRERIRQLENNIRNKIAGLLTPPEDMM